MSQLVKVGWFSKSSNNLEEIYQQTGMLFAFVSSTQNNLLQCHEWVKCRDYLPDAVRTQITHKPCSIYGFTFDTNENPAIDLNKIRMLVTKSSLGTNDKIDKFEQKIRCSLRLVNHFEKMAGVTKSVVDKVDISKQKKYKAIYMFTGSIIWLKSPFLVSMYTFLIRLGDKEIEFTNNLDLKEKFERLVRTKHDDNDLCYLGNSWNKLDLIMRNRSKLFPAKNGVHDIYWENYSISTFHNSTGLNSLTRYITPNKTLNNKLKALVDS